MTAATLRPEQRLRLIGVLALVFLPHFARIPAWASLAVASILGWQALAALRGWPAPGRAPRLLLAGGAFVAVYLSFGRIDGQHAGVALLLLMLALKLTEIRHHRDVMVLLVLCYFVLITHFLFSQEIVMVAFLAGACWLITACFMDANHPQGALPMRTALAGSGTLMAQALPIAALLFVLFPRIPGPLWGLPSDSGSAARTGLSEFMEPGAIGRVALSDEVAFRVSFEDALPRPDQRYWRGPVFWSFDGRRWTEGRPQFFVQESPERDWGGAPVRYQLTLEPHRRDWLLALDLPASTPKDTRIDVAGSLRTRRPVTSRTSYRLASRPSYRLQADPPAALLDYARRVPHSGNPRAKALAADWRESGMAPTEIVDAALRRFNEQPYRYTLQPAVLSGSDRIDRFLFETREGFCEHYAGAFTFLMRAAGVPARVVTGYQGGSTGLGGDYLIVRGADAHAWSEVWLDGRGWVRVDPTSAVSPARIESGLGASLGADEPVPYLARHSGDLLYRLQMGWDWTNAFWNRWFLAYGPQLQGDFMQRLGLPGWRNMILALTALLTVFLALLGVVLIRQARPRGAVDPVQAAWLRLCRKLAAAGVARRPHEGPLDYAERAAHAHPEHAGAFRRLASWYAKLRYRGGPEPDRARFVRAARAFRVRRGT